MGSDLDTEMVNLIYSDIAYLSWMMFWNEDVFARMQIKYESFKIARSYICVYLHTVQASAVWVESQPYMLEKCVAVKYVYFSQELSTMEPHSVLIRQSPAHKFANRSLQLSDRVFTTLTQFHTPEQSVGVFVAAVRNLDNLRDSINDVIVSGTPEILSLIWQGVEHFSNCLGAIYETCQTFVLTGTNSLI